MRNTYSIKCVLRPDKQKADGTVPIYYAMRVGPVPTRIPSGKSILAKDWNKAEACPKNNSRLNSLLATFLRKKMTDWETFMLSEENLGKTVSLTNAMAFFNENAKLTFFMFWEQQMNLWQNSKRDNTLKSYRSVLNMLKSYNSNLNFGDLTYDMLEKFDLYMATVKHNAVGGRFVKHKCLKAMCNEAIKKGHLKKNPYAAGFKIKASKGNREFLTIAEVRTLMDLELPQEDTFQQHTLKLFLFSCLTGLRYSDVMNLTWENINVDAETIILVQSKTNKPISIPLTENALAIIESYGKHTIRTAQGKVFPQIANQVLNRNLKEIMKIAGISKSISYHCSRHSFGSNLIEANANIIHVRDLMGHSRIAETQIYAKALKSDLINSMNTMQNIYGKITVNSI